jgi:hypothetical protein
VDGCPALAPGKEAMGVELSPLEAEALAEAIESGELLVTPDVPVSSAVERAWWRFCLSNGSPFRSREITWQDIEQRLREKGLR